VRKAVCGAGISGCGQKNGELNKKLGGKLVKLTKLPINIIFRPPFLGKRLEKQ
jgi:hypothetical protein